MSKAQLNQFPHSIGLAPQQAQGVRALGPLIIPFPGQATGLIQTYSDDFQLEEMDGSINAIQSVWVDSTLMSLSATLTINETGQQISIPPNSQGFVPVFAANSMTYSVTTQNAQTTLFQLLKLCFFNTPCSPGIWRVDNGLPAQVTSTSGVGNAAMSTSLGGGFPVPSGQQSYIDGVLIGGSGATAGQVATLSLTGIYQSDVGAVSTLSIPFQVPTLPENLELMITFPRPLLCGVSKLGNTIQSSGCTIAVTAMGAGQTSSSLSVFWHAG